MNSKHRRTLDTIFDRPTRSDIRWSDVEALVRALGGEVVERQGSRVALIIDGTRAVFIARTRDRQPIRAL